ncbi:hypothetical protein AQUCO_05100026v1 [Aquilegia coerulea]|uniref:Uncharacterized protein n=1 Tax=Aquilegia coerulea TaxID=218851 RepID=A0A2G5CK66_AQUCA|nr:hypothetical protein AQUCO_05100026v1 [Aquilegia coerulea]
MLAVSPLISNNGREGEMENFSIDFDEFSCGNLLDDVNFDDIFIGIGDGDVLPDLEMDSDMLAEFSLSGGEESEINASFSISNEKVEEEDRGSGSSGSGSGSGSGLTSNQGEEIVSKRYESVKVNSTPKDTHKGRKSSKGSHGKRKMKKYRSHQKHLRAREAEAASWNQRRQIYGGVGGGSKRDMAPWPAATMGFPPPAPIPPFPRPLHVWGHPAVDKSVMHMWPKHIAHPPPATRPPWTQPPPQPPPLTQPYPPPYCHPQQLVPNALTPGTPCFPPTHAPTRFPTPHVPGIPPHPMYKVDHSISVASGQSHPHPLSIDFHPSKESIDAAIGDVLSKPWLPLPLGLKPPALDSVMGELQRQGVPKIPPSTSQA